VNGIARAVAAVVAVVSATWAAAAAPLSQWTRDFYGLHEAGGGCVLLTSDSGYLVMGGTTTDTFDYGYYYLVKTDSAGAPTWHLIDGCSGGRIAHSVIQTKDGGYIIGGTKRGGRGESKGACLVKIGPTGVQQWERVVSEWTSGFTVLQAKDGGYLLSTLRPMQDSAISLMRTDSLGNPQWEGKYPMPWGMYAANIPLRPTADGGYILGARALIKVDSAGNQQWTGTYGGAYGVISVLQINDHGYIATGWTQSDTPPGLARLFVLRTDSLGGLIWSRTYGSSTTDGRGNWIEQLPGGHYVVCGFTGTGAGRQQPCVMRLDAEGSVVWEETMPGTGAASCVRKTVDGGYIVAGGRNGGTVGALGSLFLAKLAPDSGR
jgi:hypothetical protein